jgi:type III secretion protein W
MSEFKAIEAKLTTKAAELEEVYVTKEEQLGQQEIAQQIETKDAMKEVFEEASNPLAAAVKKQDKSGLEEHKVRMKKSEIDRLEKRILPVEEVKQSAERFSKRNPELKSQILQLLLDKIKGVKDKDELLKILAQFYSDPTVADDALDFLLETTVGDLNKIVQEAKDAHNAQFGREIAAGKNIASEVMKATDAKLGTPTTLRDLYRDITGTPREPVNLFIELSDRFAYKDLRKVLAFLFHSLGTDLKAQGPSIPPGLLHRLLSEVRSLQAILGVYQFFRMRMRLIDGLFKRNNLEMPKQLTFELISKQFVTLLQERYPSGDKVLQTAGKLGIEKWILAKIIIFSQLRDAIREVALSQFYRSIDHRNELYNAILEALEQLEDELDELLEGEDEEEEEGGKGKGKGKGNEEEGDQKGKK